MERVVLTARVERENGRYVASVDGLDVHAEGESADDAREELVQSMIRWISTMDCSENMVDALADAGFPEVHDETELHLEFLDTGEEHSDGALNQDD